jgi:hypothetical protein
VRRILELPLPRVSPLGLPFYNNFLLSVGETGSRYLVASANQPYLVYLFHLIEFVDMSDGMPSELRRHPNIHITVSDKIRRMKRTLSLLARRYEIRRTADFVAAIRAGSVGGGRS